MKILLVSDSHGDNSKLDILYNRHPNMDYYLHAGDSCSFSMSIYPFISIRGNCDYESDFENQLILDTPIGTLLMRHIGDIQESIIKKYKVKIFVFGHTHRRLFSKINGVYYINPGSISLPRDSNGLSYAIIEISKDDVKVNFLNI